MNRGAKGVARVVGAGMLLCTGAAAEEVGGDIVDGDPNDRAIPGAWWSGAWEEMRRTWESTGVSLGLAYLGEGWANVAGGRRTGVVYDGSLEMDLELDLERLIRWPGATFSVGGIVPHGESVSLKLVGDWQAVSNLDTFRHGPMLYQLWLEQAWLDDALSLRAGLLLADEEFAGSESGSLWLNSAFGWPSGISLNTRHTGPAYFRPAAGVRVRWLPSERWTVSAGAYDGDTFDGDLAGDRGPDFDLTSDGGAFGIVEVARTWGTDATGRVWFGAWGHTADHVVWLEPEARDPHGGLYAGVEQDLGRWDDAREHRLWRAHARLGGAPAERSVVDLNGDVGISWDGLLPRRWEDSMGVGVVWMRVSDDFREAARDVGEIDPRAGEVAVEWTWRIRVGAGWTVQPDFQWVLPVGGADGSAAHVFGLRSTLYF